MTNEHDDDLPREAPPPGADNEGRCTGCGADDPHYEGHMPGCPLSPFAERMMPGQEPYTPKERAIRDSRIADAARAEELIPSEELEEHAKKLRHEKGWDVFNDPTVDQHGDLWFEIERDDEAALYASDEEAAREHFACVRVDNRIWARQPITEAGKAKVRAYLEALQAELLARRVVEDTHSTTGKPDSDNPGSLEDRERSVVRALNRAARAARLSNAMDSPEGRAKVGEALWARVQVYRDQLMAEVDRSPLQPLFQAFQALTEEERRAICEGRIRYPEAMLAKAPAEFQRRTAICDWLFKHVASEKLVRVSHAVICEECKKPYGEHVEIHPTFVLLCDGRVGKV